MSCLKRLKTYLRSTMDAARLTAFALLHTHYNLEIDINAVIGRFQRKHPGRLVAVDFMS